MILHPAILALCTTAVLASAIMLIAGWYGLRIIGHWDMTSGSELQIELERRTYLVSTLVGLACLMEFLSLFLYIFTADSLHSLFTGAMCAAGSLNLNRYGYPVLLLKVITALGAALWLIVNHADSRGYDYPLIKTKHRLLLLLLPLVVAESALQFLYFLNLRADVITSCCGSLFSRSATGVAGEVTHLPVRLILPLFFGGLGMTVLSGGYYLLRNRGLTVYALISALFFLVAGAALLSFLCLYIYDMPSHHCPFCLLQKEYGHVGYLLYASLLGGGISGMGAGILTPFRRHPSIAALLPRLQRRLVLFSLALFVLFSTIVCYHMAVSPLRIG